ncbi:hypothetical protein DM860_003152 [Cuscuta australis]|uniref:Bromo domain-containing protein n=1 Tax=Cuscuta australis TaxID=267555 RepID=A0A328D5G4_9ASTE|nr:hypothetical protein DM860_003152 [Cuscuta australis]
MASAVLASRNDSSWAQSGDAGGGFMGKTPYSHPHMNPNSNPGSNPKKKQKHFHQAANGRVNEDCPVVAQAASDDAYSFNQRPIESNGFNFGGYLTYNVPSYTKVELNELRKRLLSELDQIRNLKDRIESGLFSTTVSNPRSHGKSKKFSGNKRPVPFGSNKDLKNLCNGVDIMRNSGSGVVIQQIDLENMMKECKQVLAKLMKQKISWPFNKPVDAVAMGLPDYHQIVKMPMDLGTVKSNLAKCIYQNPSQFAADVRLTFNNAMLYNPITDEVHGLADQLLSKFEELFRPLQEKLNRIESEQRDFISPRDELQGSSWNHHIPSPDRGIKKPNVSNSSPIRQVSKKQERFSNHSSASTPSAPVPHPLNPPQRQPSPVPTSSPVRAPPQMMPAARGPVPKLPKPKAKDPNKREMHFEEKHKLGMELQNLPEEKMPQLVQIIRKRNQHLAQDGDEIELDIEALDTETLWELDRFVTNWKKMVSKTKRQALMGNVSAPTASAGGTVTSNADGDSAGLLSEKIDSPKKPIKGETGDEDVDIDDEDDDTPAPSFPTIEIEKDEGGGGGGGREPDNGSSSSSSSGSSSSDSSSSSGSDSGSSGSDSDADDAQS